MDFPAVRGFFITILYLTIFIPGIVLSQYVPQQVHFYTSDPAQRAFDSLMATRIPVLEYSSDALSQVLPDSLDNSSHIWFPGILDQYTYFACQQYCGSAYTFAYEMNRARNVNGQLPENRYPAHYMWHFFNEGDKHTGVNFLHTFHAMMEQGHITSTDYGSDTSQLEKGWITGYDKYYRAMKNRIRNIYSLPVNSTEGILAVKQYLYDHLDGSSTGGVACFTASSPSNMGGIRPLPPDSPEAGKDVLVDWLPYPTHGMTIIGYHDSIRYDLNMDGLYTNDIDINEDGIVDARDWEIGGFRLANSYGQWWSDAGYFYVLYHAMASDFEEGGVWNNCVYIVEPDPDYSPLLTLKIHLEHNRRDQLNIIAGVSQDLQDDFPDYVIQPPIFNHQGGPMYMQGFDFLPGQKNLEFGIDVTPLMSYLEPGSPAKFFLIIEERDIENLGEGILHEASFIHYGNPITSFPCNGQGISIRHNGTTILSATGTVTYDSPVILDEELPPFSPYGTCSVQLQATDGEAPYSWNLHQPYKKMKGDAVYTPFSDIQVYPQTSGKPYTAVALPFAFPFFGKSFDTVYMNVYGMVHFSEKHLPYPYLCSATDMLDYISAITPGFSWDYVIRPGDGDGMWISSSPDSVRFRWKLSLAGMETQTNVEFGLTLFPDGKVTFCYGPAQLEPNSIITWCGISSGDKYNTLVTPIFDQQSESGNSITWFPPTTPGRVILSPDGSLTVTGADTNLIYDIPVRVTDMQDISTDKLLKLSSGLIISHELSSISGYLKQSEPASIDIEVTNISQGQLEEITLQFFCERPELLLSDSLSSAGMLAGGQSVNLTDAFSCTLQTHLPDEAILPCRIVATSEGKSWEYRFNLEVSAIDLKLKGMEVEDGVNGLLEAGETADLVFILSNTGSLPAEDLHLTLSSQDEFFEIVSSQSLQFGSLGKNAIREALFTVRAAKNTPPGHLANLELMVTNNDGLEIIFTSSLTMGTNQIALITLTSTTTTTSLMSGYLDSLQLGYDQHTTLPDNMNIYPVSFIILGTSYPGSYTLSIDENVKLINYLNNGGNVYMESYSSWFYGAGVMLEEIFKFSAGRVNSYSFEEMSGVTGTLTEGMDYQYIAPIPYAIFEVVPKGEGFALMHNKGDSTRCLEFGYAGSDYKTIGTFIEFGQLVDSEPPSRKAILFKKYLEFLEVNIEGPFPFFHADTTHLCQWHHVQFTDDSFDDVLSWQWEFPGGTPAASEEQNPVVQYHSPGVYDVILTVSDGLHAETMHKKRYIHINVCADVETIPSPANEIHVFPNPAKDHVTIALPFRPEGEVHADIFDLGGTVVSHMALSGSSVSGEFPIDTSVLAPGIYIIRISWRNESFIKKLVIF
jgi:hypothetical protein